MSTYAILVVTMLKAAGAAATNLVRCVREATPAAAVAGATDECDHKHII